MIKPRSPHKNNRFSQDKNKPRILEAHEHPIHDDILPLEVVWILNRLRWAGHLGYLVGGGVRDLLLGETPKDFDLSTDATPSQIRNLFYNCRIIGRRFRIAHIYFRDSQIIEVTTFRGLPSSNKKLRSPLQDDNKFGSPVEDAWRRDITVNGLFYDSETGCVIDYVDGLDDLEERIARTIGDPNIRFQEDPVRMIRVIRHSARLNFTIAPGTWSAIRRHATKLNQCSEIRVLEEFLRELRSGHSADSFHLFQESGLLTGFSPNLQRWIQQNQNPISGAPYRRFGNFVRPHWATHPALIKNLASADRQMPLQPLSDIVLVAALLAPLGWSFVFQHSQAGTRTAQLWSQAFRQLLEPITRDIKLRANQRESLFQLFQAYWRLHLLPKQSGLQHSLRKNVYQTEAAQLLKLELHAHQLPIPEWLEQLSLPLDDTFVD